MAIIPSFLKAPAFRIPGQEGLGTRIRKAANMIILPQGQTAVTTRLHLT